MSSTQPSATHSAWEDRIERIRTKHDVPAIAAAIVRNGEIAWFKGFGQTEIGNDAPPHENSIFRVASNTKTVTAASLMMLKEASMLSLEDPLLLHIPEFTAANGRAGDLEDVTLKRLATHYSGLTTEHPATDWGTPRFPKMQEILDRIDEIEMVIPPDSQWKYSNLAYALLGETIARLSGRTYTAFALSELLSPLGMTNTTFDAEDIAEPDRVVGYSQPSPEKDTLRVAPYAPLNGLDSAGQMMTSVSDLAKWIDFHISNQDETALPKT